MTFLLLSAAIKALSLSKFSNSAPLNPIVFLAKSVILTFSFNFLFFECNFKMASRPSLSGKPTANFKSNRPARIKAGSRISSLFVAQIVKTLSALLKPSNSASSALIVWSFSLLLDSPRPPPIASISSINTIQGAAFLAFLYNSLTRDAPTPTYFSTKSEPHIEKKGTSASPAIAFAVKVLPVPGGPYRITPLGILAPNSSYFLGFFKQSTRRYKSGFNSSIP